MDKRDLIERCREHNVRFVRLQFTELHGHLKNISIPVEELGKALDNELMFDGSSIRGYKRIEQSDMYFHPDPSTFAVLPWRHRESGATARLICDVADPDGTPFAGDPRVALKRVMARAAERGYTMSVGPEAEFFLFKRDASGNPTVDTHDKARYFDVAPSDLGEETRRDIEDTLAQMGFKLEASHHEVAIGQHEIDFRHDDPLATADNLITFRWVVRVIAAEHGMHATFMPKPIYGENGSGMHVNQSLAKDGRNAFYDADGELQLSDDARAYIAGLLTTSRASRRSRTRSSTPTSGSCPGTRPRLRRLVARQPLGRDPRPGQARQLDARGAPDPRPLDEPVPGLRGHAGGRDGRHREGPDAARAGQQEHLPPE
jgi:glutamine synthetase